MIESVEIYRVYARSKSNGCVMKSWTYQTKKAFDAQKKRRDNWSTYYDIVCEKFDPVSGSWQPLTQE